MPSCPLCHTTYPPGTAVCARDGVTLVAADAGAPTVTASATAPPPASSPASTTPTSTAVASAAAAQPATTPTPTTAASTGAEPAPKDGDGAFDSLVGSTLAGRYQVLRRIGEGGMGAVYEARHALLGKRVAVKVLLEKFIAKSDFVARLLQEARLASAIGHQNIVDVTDFGTTDDGRSFVVMEFLDGESLAQLAIREAPLPIERCLRIARQAASALGAAHAKGIFHRDVKPENIYLVRRGDADFVKVVDFGISKAVKPLGEEGTDVYRLTHTGLLLGTPLYMSPEQARGEEDLDHRVDIWALGVMLYECLTGEVPFRANNYLQIIAQVLNHEPLPPSQLRPELGIPDAVEMVVMRAMEKDRSRRYQAMADLERDIDRLLAGDQNVGLPPLDPASVAEPRRPRRWPLALASAAVLLGGVVWAVRHPTHPPDAAAPPTAATTAAPDPSTAAAAPAAPPRPAAAAEAPAAPATPPPGAAAVPAPVPGRRRVRPAAERGASRAADVAPGSDPAKAVMRGVLPSGSKEGYPDK